MSSNAIEIDSSRYLIIKDQDINEVIAQNGFVSMG